MSARVTWHVQLKEMIDSVAAARCLAAKSLPDAGTAPELFDATKRAVREATAEELIIPGCVARFYSEVSFLSLSWSPAFPLKDQGIRGVCLIPPVDELFAPVPVSEVPRLHGQHLTFMRFGASGRITMVLEKPGAEPVMFYFKETGGKPLTLELSFDDVLDRMIRAKALIPWPDFYVTDPKFRLGAVDVRSFVPRLNLLFPELDTSHFKARLAARAKR